MSGKLEIGEGSLVCDEALIISSGEHNIEIGAKTIVHPLARIEAISGPIIIGEGNIIEEFCEIINNVSEEPLIIGNSNLFEVGSAIHANKVGTYNVFKPRCRVDANSSIGNGCMIGSTVHIQEGTAVGDNSVLFRFGDSRESYGVHTPSNNTERNMHHISLCQRALSDPKKKCFLGKHHKTKNSYNFSEVSGSIEETF
mmetsp:Transcript_16185/g.21439  ORF Transcript_16185/g.21439 Transcript_16185/m.21439 type:complete len:198 (+) Transcript_16185:30-623(+)